eukprot:scaffold373_cov350-Pavlova_lutheri.AAC.23
MDPYQALGLNRGCSDEEVKRAYRLKVLASHPDTNPHLGDQGAEQFRKATEAYEMLKDKQKRESFDRMKAAASFSGRGYEKRGPNSGRRDWEGDQFWREFEKRFYQDTGYYWKKEMDEERKRQAERDRIRWWEEEKREAARNKARFENRRHGMEEAKYRRIYRTLQDKWMASKGVVWQDILYLCMAGSALAGLAMVNKSRLERRSSHQCTSPAGGDHPAAG